MIWIDPNGAGLNRRRRGTPRPCVHIAEREPHGAVEPMGRAGEPPMPLRTSAIIATVTRPRRAVLQLGLGAAAFGLVTRAPAEGMIDKAKETFGLKAEEVTPPEDLMREHGVLDRVLLIYEAAMHRFAGNQEFDPKVIADAASLVRDFVEDYHEKSEEQFIFPRFRKADTLVEFVDTLKSQHDAGRRVTSRILERSPASRTDEGARRDTVAAMQAFIAMYRPHAAGEDTDLFPKLRSIVSAHEVSSIGEEMEKQEKQKFGDDGFEKAVARVAELEKSIGIADLKQFTPAG
jgi:hemerythrin-like domain-containing protein